MNYAVIVTGGKQYIVTPKQSFTTDKIAGKSGDKVVFDNVLLYVNDDKATVGSPMLAGVSVEGKIVTQKRDDKVRVAKYKAKSRYRKVKGFRAQITEIMIESIKEKKKA